MSYSFGDILAAPISSPVAERGPLTRTMNKNEFSIQHKFNKAL